MRPELPRWDAVTVFEALGIPWLPDESPLEAARTERHLFEALVAELGDVPKSTLNAMASLARKVRWDLAPLLADARRLGPARSKSRPATVARPEPLRPVPKPVRVDVAALEAMLAPGGPLAAEMAGFEDRPGQRDMLRRVAEALNLGDQLLVEAGTGTGKSLAYLLPAAAWAVANARSVVVSTHTTTLQEQLFRKDIPQVADLLADELVVSVLKGRANYLCRTRLAGVLNRDDLDLDLVRGLAKVMVWATRTGTGDRAELNLAGPELRAWRLVSADGEACTPDRCTYARQGADWVQRARARAEAAHVVVVNHALLLSDVRVDNRLLPPHRQLIIDEAHHLEAVATDQLAFGASESRLRDALAVLDGGGRGLLARIDAAVKRSEMPEDGRQQVANACDGLRATVRAAVPATGDLFGQLNAFLAEHGGGAAEVRLTPAAREQPSWLGIELAWDELRRQLEALRKGLSRLNQTLLAHETLIEDTGALTADLATALRELAELAAGLERVISRPGGEDVTWLARSGTDRVALHLAPLHVGEILARGLWDEQDTVVLTSATLRAGPTFELLKERLGLPEASELALDSPFDYEVCSLLCLPTDMPEPNQPGYQTTLSQVLLMLGQIMGGRTLALFTSYQSLNAVYHQIRGPLGQAGITVLGQGLDGERHQLMARFRAPDRPTVLLGTRSFWEGIDVPGEALSCLVITRLPFDVPTDPVFAARSETFESPFFQYAVPLAVLRFRQGFGRLIRSQADRGVVVVLDRRVQTKGYGSQFLATLPPCRVHRGPLGEMGAVVRGFLAADG